MKKTKKEIRARLIELFGIMLDGGTILIKDVDGVIKESRISAIYSDNILILPDVIDSVKSIWAVTIPREKETTVPVRGTHF